MSVHISICVHSCPLQPLGARGSLPIKLLIDLDGGSFQQAGAFAHDAGKDSVPDRTGHGASVPQTRPVLFMAARLNQLGPPRESQEEKEPHISGREFLLGEEFTVVHDEIGKSRVTVSLSPAHKLRNRMEPNFGRGTRQAFNINKYLSSAVLLIKLLS